MPDDATVDTVSDDETLYRRVPRNSETSTYYSRGVGRIAVLSQAFSERPIDEGQPFAGQYRLSVDRAKLRDFRPELTQRGAPTGDPESFAVVWMPAGEVRAIDQIEDVVPDPIKDEPGLEDNPAHALICVRYDPAATKSANRKTFREAISALADVANRRPWPIEPRD